MTSDDPRLVETLRRAFAPDHLEPPEERIRALHEAVIGEATCAPRRGSGRVWARRSSALVLSTTVVLGAAGVAAAERGTPPPLRALAHSLGLPVAGPSYADARATLGRLRGELARRNPPGIRKAVATLEEQMQDLDPGEAHRLQRDAAPALAAAEAVSGHAPRPQPFDPIAEPVAPGPVTAATPTPNLAPTPTDTATTTPPPVDTAPPADPTTPTTTTPDTAPAAPAP